MYSTWDAGYFVPATRQSIQVKFSNSFYSNDTKKDVLVTYQIQCDAGEGSLDVEIVDKDGNTSDGCCVTGDPVECQPVSAHGMDSGVVLDAGRGGLRRRSSLLCVAELASMVSSFLFPAGLC